MLTSIQLPQGVRENLQVDVDVGSSTSASSVVGLVAGAVKNLVIDMAVVLQVCIEQLWRQCVKPANPWQHPAAFFPLEGPLTYGVDQCKYVHFQAPGKVPLR